MFRGRCCLAQRETASAHGLLLCRSRTHPHAWMHLRLKPVSELTPVLSLASACPRPPTCCEHAPLAGWHVCGVCEHPCGSPGCGQDHAPTPAFPWKPGAAQPLAQCLGEPCSSLSPPGAVSLGCWVARACALRRAPSPFAGDHS